jgi:glycosidase
MLVRAHQYLIAKYDVDGFRIDTVKYVAPDAVQTFGNAVREYALSVGKRNFFTFGEVYDNEQTIANFVGRNSTEVEGFGIDAALDFPLFYKLPRVAKGQEGVESIREVFRERKRAIEGLISSHGEAGRFFVSFLDNHDQHERFKHPQTPAAQVTLGLAALFCLQGIPCLYYGTEQGLDGTRDADGSPDPGGLEAVREALWGKPDAFDRGHPLSRQIQSLSRVRREEPALRYGRIYFREASGNGRDFGLPAGAGGLLAFSRVLNDREVLLAANTSPSQRFEGLVLVDRDLARASPRREVAYSNLGTEGSGDVRLITDARFHNPSGAVTTGTAAAVFVSLAPSEAQIIAPD